MLPLVSCRAKDVCLEANDIIENLEKTGWGKQFRLEIYRKLLASGEQKKRESENDDEINRKWHEKGNKEYDSSDVYDFIASLGSEKNEAPLAGAVKFVLHMPNKNELRKSFPELEPSRRQTGLDDINDARYREEWYALGLHIVQSGRVSLGQQFLRRGCPASLRPALWRIVLLYMDDTPSEKEMYEYSTALRNASIKKSQNEISSTLEKNAARDNDYYFPFEETLSNVMKAVENPKFPKFIDLMHYASPLAFLYAREEQLFSCFFLMYQKFWYKLHIFSLHDTNSLIPLCKLFEHLLAEKSPTLFLHLLQLNIQPLSIALPWIQSAFVSLLDVDQLLLLWDRIIGFNGDLSLLPILATAIFLFRAHRLLQVSSPLQVHALLSDCSLLSVVPLLQLFIWGVESAQVEKPHPLSLSGVTISAA
mmetsp:Transcript_23261/g.30135  ORF Transcript_23261/g.30135 Transcript_23261/m.30135 type:complete len:421 (+) Transcript_23261:710-1972(+)